MLSLSADVFLTRYRGKVQGFNHSIRYSSLLVFPKWQNEVAGINRKNRWVIQFGFSLITQLKNHNTQFTKKKSMGNTHFTKILYLEL